MFILPPLLFAISASIDNFTVGIAYGMKKIRIGLLSNVLIAVISGIGTFLSMTVGLLLSNFLSPNMSNIIGSAILILLGLWFIAEYMIKTIKKHNEPDTKNSHMNYIELLDEPENADLDKSGYIDVKESVTLALALTINNLGLGIGASISGMNIWLTSLFTFLISIPTILLGCKIGSSFLSKFFGKYAPLVSGLIIVILGVCQLFY